MVAFADTSFLFALYGNDVHTSKALTWVSSVNVAIRVSAFGDYELGNALRFAEFRKALPAGKAVAHWADYEADRASGRIVLESCNLAAVIAEANRLSSIHTLQGGHRAFDILHVAASIHLRASEFLTFDANQKRLAASEGLGTPMG